MLRGTSDLGDLLPKGNRGRDLDTRHLSDLEIVEHTHEDRGEDARNDRGEETRRHGLLGHPGVEDHGHAGRNELTENGGASYHGHTVLLWVA
jgi:hypothetical protein